jgi:hypothetical protein
MSLSSGKLAAVIVILDMKRLDMVENGRACLQ